MDKTLYLIAGSNGAGKSTSGKRFIPKNTPIFDGDKTLIKYSKEVSNWNPIKKALKSVLTKGVEKVASQKVKEEFTTLINNSIKNNTSFAYETNFHTMTALSLPTKLKNEEKYKLGLVFFVTDNVEVNKDRVDIRVKKGGHPVGHSEIKLRWKEGLQNLNKHFDKFDHFKLIHSENNKPQAILETENGKLINYEDKILNNNPYLKQILKEYVPRLNEEIGKYQQNKQNNIVEVQLPKEIQEAIDKGDINKLKDLENKKPLTNKQVDIIKEHPKLDSDDKTIILAQFGHEKEAEKNFSKGKPQEKDNKVNINKIKQSKSSKKGKGFNDF